MLKAPLNPKQLINQPIFTARRYSSAVLAAIACLSVRQPVCHKPALHQRLNLASCKQRHTVAQTL